MVTKRKGRYVATGVTAKGKARTEKANLANMLRAKEAALAVREATVAAREAAVAEAEKAAKEKQQQQGPEADTRTPQQEAREQKAAQQRDDLAPRTGSLLDISQSRSILLTYFELVQSGVEPNKAIQRTASTLRVGKDKVFKVRAHWWEKTELLTSSAEGRGVSSGKDGRKLLDDVQCANLRAFISDKHENGQQVFRRTVREWIKETCNKDLSNRAVGGLLYRIGYRRRRGRIKIPPLNDDRKARIRRFLVEMSAALTQEEKKEAVIVYMDESFCHQLHGSAYSYFLTDDDGVVQDGMGRTSGKGLRMIMVHAITKGGALAAVDENNFPIPEGWFKPKDKGKGRQGAGSMGTEETAEMLWQAKRATGDYHDAMTDKMFMEWLERRLAPAFKAKYGNKKMILVLDNASYHHGYDAEVGVPESNSKGYNTGLLRKYKRRKITVEREVTSSAGVRSKKYTFQVPATGTFPQANSKCGKGVSGPEVALATRAFFQLKHPTKLMEKVETFMNGRGWQLIWTPPYMPSFQPIELFWQHGKQYVSFNFKTKRTMAEVWAQVRKGWYGDLTWEGQKGGWKPADCSKLVAHAVKEMNKWVASDPVLRGQMGALEQVPESYEDDAPGHNDIVHDDGVEAQEQLELSAELMECMGDEDADGDAEV
ncbi:unnamed protein product [Ectocarpus sp. 4 AP-2014]